MSSAQRAKQEDSATQTKTSDAPKPAAFDTKGETDAEVVSETPNPPRPKVARPADVKPLSAVGDGPFGGEVSDTANATRARQEPAQGAQKGKRKRKAPDQVDEPSAEEVKEKAKVTAMGMLTTVDGIFRGWAQRRYEPVCDAATLANIDRQLKLPEAEKEALADPLAEGLLEMGVEMPWWAKLAFAGAGIYGPKLAALAALDRARDEFDQREAAARGS